MVADIFSAEPLRAVTAVTEDVGLSCKIPFPMLEDVKLLLVAA
jgi:hypothetical protein